MARVVQMTTVLVTHARMAIQHGLHMIAASVLVPSQLRGLQWLQQLTRLTLKLNVRIKESATVKLENATASTITMGLHVNALFAQMTAWVVVFATRRSN